MVEDEDYRRKAKIAVVAIVVLASLAVFATFVAFAYYCYISHKVSKRRRKSHKGLFCFCFCSVWFLRKYEKMGCCVLGVCEEKRFDFSHFE